MTKWREYTIIGPCGGDKTPQQQKMVDRRKAVRWTDKFMRDLPHVLAKRASEESEAESKIALAAAWVQVTKPGGLCGSARETKRKDAEMVEDATLDALADILAKGYNDYRGLHDALTVLEGIEKARRRAGRNQRRGR